MSRIERIDAGTGRQPLHTVASTRRIETAAAAGLPPSTLMGRAGEALARLAVALAPHAREVLVAAGPGNNGGDGYEAAARLQAAGRRVTVVQVATASAGALPADAAGAAARATDAGVTVLPFARSDAAWAASPALVIDALLGIGASRPPEGVIAEAIRRIASLAARGAHVLAVDVPSGLDVDRGQPLGADCVVAADTLSFITLKPGLFTAEGRDRAGRVWFASLLAEPRDVGADAWLVGRSDPTCAQAPRRHAQNKGSFGDVAVVGGAPGMAGAAWLAARAAQGAGAGRVFVDHLADDAGEPAAGGVDPLRPELMVRPGWAKGSVETLARGTVVCGCGGGDAVRAALPHLLSSVRRLVLDADALNALAADPALATLAAARAGRGLATILTPHPLEAARLLGRDAAAVQADRLAAAAELVVRYGAVVVLKGSGSVIAAPGEAPRINATGNAALAGAGTGDVLAGWIGGRWAGSEASAFDVATRCVVEHGAAADPERPGSLLASELVDELHRRSRRP